MNMLQFIYSFTRLMDIWVNFQFGAITNKASMNFSIQVFV